LEQKAYAATNTGPISLLITEISIVATPIAENHNFIHLQMQQAFFAVTEDGTYLSTDEGKSWKIKNSQLVITLHIY